MPRPHRLAFPALLLGNAALAFGPWLVRLSDVGPAAVGLLASATVLRTSLAAVAGVAVVLAMLAPASAPRSG